MKHTSSEVYLDDNENKNIKSQCRTQVFNQVGNFKWSSYKGVFKISGLLVLIRIFDYSDFLVPERMSTRIKNRVPSRIMDKKNINGYPNLGYPARKNPCTR